MCNRELLRGLLASFYHPKTCMMHTRWPQREEIGVASEHLTFHSVRIVGATSHCSRSRRESNPHLRFRKPLFYPLNYGNNDIFDPFDSLCSLRTSFYIFDCRLQTMPCG